MLHVKFLFGNGKFIFVLSGQRTNFAIFTNPNLSIPTYGPQVSAIDKTSGSTGQRGPCATRQEHATNRVVSATMIHNGTVFTAPLPTPVSMNFRSSSSFVVRGSM